MRTIILLAAWLVLAEHAAAQPLKLDPPMSARDARARERASSRLGAEILGAAFGTGAAAGFAFAAFYEKPVSPRDCDIDSFCDEGPWIEIHPLITVGLVYALIAPVTVGMGVAIGGSAAGGSPGFGQAIAGGAIGSLATVLLAICLAPLGQDGAVAGLMAGGLLLPSAGAIWVYESWQEPAPSPAKRARSVAWQPYAHVAPDGHGVSVGAVGAF